MYRSLIIFIYTYKVTIIGDTMKQFLTTEKKEMRVDDVAILDKLRHGAVLDFVKPGFDKFERAKLLKDHMDAHGLSYRELARKLNIPAATIHGWIKYLEIEDEYIDMIDSGMSETDISNVVKRRKKITESKPKDPFLARVEYIRMEINKLKYDLNESNFNADIMRELQGMNEITNKLLLKADKLNK